MNYPAICPRCKAKGGWPSTAGGLVCCRCWHRWAAPDAGIQSATNTTSEEALHGRRH